MNCRIEIFVMSLKSVNAGTSPQNINPMMMTEIAKKQIIFFWKEQRGILKTALFHEVSMLMIRMLKSKVTRVMMRTTTRMRMTRKLFWLSLNKSRRKGQRKRPGGRKSRWRSN